ncbi:hypothetical protein QL093DRAFT_2540178, partial [Fusarium oxysporum]
TPCIILYKPIALVGLILPSLGLADTFDACSTSKITTCNCLTTPVKRFRSRDFTFPEPLFPCTANSCSGDTPPCCVEKGPGPFGDDQLDVIDGVVYMIEECPASGPYFGKKFDDDPITLNTKLRKWPFNSYCILSPTECWVPFDAIIATFKNLSVSLLCNTTVYVAVGISVSSKRCASGFMYFILDLKCPEICLRKCCCPALPPPPPETKSCSIGTAFGYGDGFKNLNRDPYFTPSEATLTAGISGLLIIGAGQNDISKGTKAGTWSASLTCLLYYFILHAKVNEVFPKIATCPKEAT